MYSPSNLGNENHDTARLAGKLLSDSQNKSANDHLVRSHYKDSRLHYTIPKEYTKSLLVGLPQVYTKSLLVFRK